MSKNKIYKLQFMFSSNDIKILDLEKKINRLLIKEINNGLELSITESNKNYNCILKGKKSLIDSCHGKINNKLLEKIPFIRMVDELGNELRLQAYEIISRIEQSLRNFINNANSRIFGLDWWNEAAPSKAREKVNNLLNKNKSINLYHNLIELTYFEDLITFITNKTRQLDPDACLTADMLKIIFSSAEGGDIRETLEAMLEESSLWENVFSKFFDDLVQWKNFEKQLEELVIPVRNQVMHFRPIMLYQMDKLIEFENKFLKVIESPKQQFTKEESAKLTSETLHVALNIPQNIDANLNLLQNSLGLVGSKLSEELISFQKSLGLAGLGLINNTVLQQLTALGTAVSIKGEQMKSIQNSLGLVDFGIKNSSVLQQLTALGMAASIKGEQMKSIQNSLGLKDSKTKDAEKESLKDKQSNET